MSDVLTALAYAAAPTVAVPVGGFVVTRVQLGARVRSALQHFAAGGLVAVIGVELLAELHQRAPVAVAIGVAVGTLFMLALDGGTRRLERKGGRWASVGFQAVVGVDFLIDGLLLGVSLGHDSSLGLVLAIALTLEDLVTGLSLALTLKKETVRRDGPEEARSRVPLVMSLLALALPVGAVLGGFTGRWISGDAYTLVLAFAAVALLFLVFEELLREAHGVAETPWTTGMLFGGLLAFLLIESMV